METITLILKFVGISTILTILYYVAYAKSASFIHCRIYLLGILFISAAVSLSKFEIYPATVHTIEIPATQKTMEHDISSDPSFNETEIAAPAENIYSFTNESAEMEPLNITSTETGLKDEAPLSATFIIFITYLGVTGLLLLRYLYQLYRIIDISRWGSVTENGGYKLVRNNKVTSPFSYFKNIYINRKLNDETLEVVLNHEMCHIKHRHYIDATIIELLSIVMWFNPLTWVIKHELRNIHEFQVDSSMIRNGLDIPKYQSIIFAELMGYSPTIANGFHNSLIKKRFIMMTQNRTVKYSLLRKLLVIPTILGLFVLFSFTDKGDIVRYVSIPNSENVVKSENVVIPTDVPTIIETPTERVKAPIIAQSEELKTTPKAMLDTLIVETTVTKIVKNDNDSIVSKITVKDSVKYVELKRNQLVISNLNSKKNTIRYIDAKEDRTLVTFAVAINSDREIIKFPSETSIRDSRTLKKLPINGVSHNIPLDENLVVTGMKGKCVEFTLSFPQLEAETIDIDLLISISPNQPTINASATSITPPLSFQLSANQSKKLQPLEMKQSSNKINYYKNLNIEKYKKVNYKYNNLTWQQTPTTEIGNRRHSQLLSVVRTDNETLVTFSAYMHFDSQWCHFGSGILIRDCKTKEKYYITKVEKDIPLNKLNVVKGKKGKYVMFTMVFPRLPDNVEKIDIIETPHRNDIPTPENGTPYCWSNINVKKNKFDARSSNNQQLTMRTHPENRYVTTIESDDKPKMELEINNNLMTHLTITLTKNEVINIPYNFAIRDVVSGKLFRAKRVDPYNFDMPVGGQKKDQIHIVFDVIPYGIDRIDIGVFTKDGEEPHDWCYKNIKINN